MMPNNLQQERQPVVSLIYLLLLAFAGAVVFTVLAYIIGFAIYGSQIIYQSQELLAGKTTEGLGFIKLVQIASTIGVFIFPSLVSARLESKWPLSYLSLNRNVNPLFILLAIAIVIASGPFLEWTISLNKEMHLPGFLKGLEQWMRQQEDQLAQLTIQLLRTANVWDLLINLLMIAILPAFGEELLFRGCLQKIITRWVGNFHWGIWIAAIIFSAIHMQFYGFLPRLLLGALFGYFLVWSKSIWVPVLAHFINNGTAVFFAYLYQQKGESLEKINDNTYDGNIYLYLFSFVLTAILLWVFYKKSLEFNQRDESKE